MAEASQWYVDSSSGSDINAGTHTGSAKASGSLAQITMGFGTFEVEQSGAFSSYTHAAGDMLRVRNVGAMGGVVRGIYPIASKTSNDVVVCTGDAGDSMMNYDILWSINGAWATAKFAIETGVPSISVNKDQKDTINGDQINLKGSFTPSATIDFSALGATNSVAAPIILRGYTSTKNDGGVATLSGAGARTIINAGTTGTGGNFNCFCDLTFENCAGDIVAVLNDKNFIVRCSFKTNTVSGLKIGANNVVYDCFFYKLGGGSSYALECFDKQNIIMCSTFDKDTTSPAAMIKTFGDPATMLINNIIKVDGATDGVYNGASKLIMIGNSIASVGGTGSGVTGGTSNRQITLINNAVQGFSGVGGIAYDILTLWNVMVFAGNTAHNNTKHYTASNDGSVEGQHGDVFLDIGDNESIGGGSTIFADVSASTDDFLPEDVGNMIAGAFPTTFLGLSLTNYKDKGALDKQSSGGASGSASWSSTGMF